MAQNASDRNIDPALQARGIDRDSTQPGEGTDAHRDAQEARDDTGILREMSDVARARTFFVKVTYIKLVTVPTGPRAAPKTKKVEETALAPRPAAMFTVSRAQFLRTVYTAFGMEDLYIVGPEHGPQFQIYWNGSTGGKTRAATVDTDDQWHVIQQQLAMKKNVDTVEVVLAKEHLEAFKSRKRVHSPDPADDHVEMVYGTRVPRPEHFTATEKALAEYAVGIKKHNPCDTHGCCYVDGDLHLVMTKFRLDAWSSYGLDKNIGPEHPPPSFLVAKWAGTDPVPPKARGRTGAGSAAAQAPAAPSSSGTSLGEAVLGAALAMMTQSMTGNVAPRRASPVRAPASSPPPAVNDELVRCLEAFGTARNIPQAAVDTAISHLDAEGYTPMSIEAAADARLRELTGFTEGRALELKVYAQKWCGRIAAKRARLSK